VEGRKMSKRDGTFFTVRDLLDPVAAGRPELAERLVAAGFPDGRVAAPVLRLALIWSHYRQPMNFSFDSLTQARTAVGRLQSLYDRAFELAGDGVAEAAVTETIAAGLAAFDEALAADLDLERGMAAVIELVSRLNQMTLTPASARAVQAALESVDQILDVLVRRRMGLVPRERLAELAAGTLPPAEELFALEAPDDAQVELLLAARQAARARRDFAAADGIRAHLRSRGILLEDLPGGIRWKSS